MKKTTSTTIKFNPKNRITECLDVTSKEDAQEWFRQYKKFHKDNPHAEGNIAYMIGYCSTKKRRDELKKWYGL